MRREPFLNTENDKSGYPTIYTNVSRLCSF